MKRGTIKFFNQSKGFGFITKDNGEEVFFHFSGLKYKDPKQGDKVEFDEAEGKKGLNAVDIKRY